MQKSRRQFLTAASGITAAATAGCATAATPTPPPNAIGDFNFMVNVIDNSNGQNINGADVHLEPRQSGLEPEDGTSFNNIDVTYQGYYDIEVSANGFHDDALLRKYISPATGSKTIYLEPV